MSGPTGGVSGGGVGTGPGGVGTGVSGGGCGGVPGEGGCCCIEGLLQFQRMRRPRVAQRGSPVIRRPLLGRARVAELVDALDLGSSIARCGGSTPSARTISAHRTSRGCPSTKIGGPEDCRPDLEFCQDFRTVSIKTVETENEGLTHAFMLII